MMKAISTAVFVVVISTLCAIGSPKGDFNAFVGGQKLKYDSQDHAKAKGIHLTIEYPKTWIAEEGQRPNIVQKFIGKDDAGNSIQCILLIKDTPLLMRFVETEVVKEDFLKQMVTEMGGTYIKSGSTKIEGQDMGWAIFTKTAERAGFNITSQNLIFIAIYKHKFVQLHFMVGGQAGESTVEDRFASYLPLFQLMANSLIFQGKWK